MTIAQIKSAADTAIRNKVSASSISPANVADQVNALADEMLARGVAKAADTTALSALSGANFKTAIVSSNGFYEWISSGTPNGSTIFAAAGGGVWSQVFTQGTLNQTLVKGATTTLAQSMTAINGNVRNLLPANFDAGNDLEGFYESIGQFDDVNLPSDPRPNVVYMFGYNQSGGGGPLTAGEASIHMAIETHFVIGADPHFEFHCPQVTTMDGSLTVRYFSVLANKVTGEGTTIQRSGTFTWLAALEEVEMMSLTAGVFRATLRGSSPEWYFSKVAFTGSAWTGNVSVNMQEISGDVTQFLIFDGEVVNIVSPNPVNFSSGITTPSSLGKQVQFTSLAIRTTGNQAQLPIAVDGNQYNAGISANGAGDAQYMAIGINAVAVMGNISGGTGGAILFDSRSDSIAPIRMFVKAEGTVSETFAMNIWSNGHLTIGPGEVDNGEIINLHGRMYIQNQSAPSTPSGGGTLYVEAGALKFIGSGGTVTTIGPA